MANVIFFKIIKRVVYNNLVAGQVSLKFSILVSYLVMKVNMLGGEISQN